MAIAYPSNPVFTPSISPRSRMIVREILPRRAARAIVLAHRSPLPLRKIRPPPLPMLLSVTRLFQSAVFDRLYSCHGLLDYRSPSKATKYLPTFSFLKSSRVTCACLARYAYHIAKPVAQGGVRGVLRPFPQPTSIGSTKTKKGLDISYCASYSVRHTVGATQYDHRTQSL